MAIRKFHVIAAAVLLLLIATKAWADPTIYPDTEEQFHVSCDNTSPPTQWLLTFLQSTVTVVLGNRPRVVTCSFTQVTDAGQHRYQSFAVYPTAIASVQCDPDSCAWMVKPDGFYVSDINSDSYVFGFPWMIAP